MTRTYVSFVVSTRNDTYKSDMVARNWMHLNGIVTQCERHKLRGELVIVEWNPPAGRPTLRELYPWPKSSTYCEVRIIQVPAEIHRRYPDSDKIQVHWAAATNAGVRRARGEFILITTADILFPDDVMSFLAAGTLDASKFYRVDRADVDRRVLELQRWEEVLNYCRAHVLQVYVNEERFRIGSVEMDVRNNGAGDFLLMSAERWRHLRGIPEYDIVSLHSDTMMSIMAYLSGLRVYSMTPPMLVYHIEHSNRWRERRSWLERFARKIKPSRFGQWLGDRVERLFPPISPLKEMGVSTISHDRFAEIVTPMVEGKRSYVYNDEHWGLGRDELPEVVVTRDEPIFQAGSRP